MKKQDQPEPVRAYTQDEALNLARKYMIDTFGPSKDAEDRSLWHQRLGMLADFVMVNFPR